MFKNQLNMEKHFVSFLGLSYLKKSILPACLLASTIGLIPSPTLALTKRVNDVSLIFHGRGLDDAAQVEYLVAQEHLQENSAPNSNNSELAGARGSLGFLEEFWLLITIANGLMAGVSATMYFLLRHDVKKYIMDKIGSDMEDRIKAEEDKMEDRIKAEEDKLGSELIILSRWSEYVIGEEITPSISSEYRKIFRESFSEGFPSDYSFVADKSEPKTKLRRFLNLVKDTEDKHPNILGQSVYFAAGDACYILEDFAKAVEFYQRSLDMLNFGLFGEPSKSLIYLQKANALIKLEKYDLAIKELERSIQCFEGSVDSSMTAENPKEGWIYYSLGMAYHNNMQYRNAIDAFKKATEKSPLSYRSMSWYGNALAASQQYSEAIAAYKSALDIVDDHIRTGQNLTCDKAWILHSMGDSYRKLGDRCCQRYRDCKWRKECSESEQGCKCYERALEFYSESIKLFKSDPLGDPYESLHKRGKTYRQIGQYWSDVENHERAKGFYENALKDLNEAVLVIRHKYPGTASMPSLLALRGYIYEKLGNHVHARQDYDEARSQCEDCLDALKDNVEKNKKTIALCYFDLARCDVLQGNLNSAQTNLDRVKELSIAMYRRLIQAEQGDSDFSILNEVAQNVEEIDQCPLLSGVGA